MDIFLSCGYIFSTIIFRKLETNFERNTYFKNGSIKIKLNSSVHEVVKYNIQPK